MNLERLFNRVLGAKYIQLQENAASYYVERVGDTLYLLFEQSNGKKDWKNNFDFPAVCRRKKQGVWFVHRGFLKVWKSIEGKIAKEIANKEVKRILIAGYSHGAALALLCHEYCVFTRPDIKNRILGYGYGCPRVAWLFANRRVKNRFENFNTITNGRDIITHLPPAFLGFFHVGKKIKIGNGKIGAVRAHTPQSYQEQLEIYEKSKKEWARK